MSKNEDSWVSRNLKFRKRIFHIFEFFVEDEKNMRISETVCVGIPILHI